MTPLECRFGGSKMIKVLLICLGFTAIGVWMVADEPQPKSFFVLLVFGSALLFLCYLRLFVRRLLTISDRGIELFYPRLPLIPWSKISAARTRYVNNQPFISLDVRAPRSRFWWSKDDPRRTTESEWTLSISTGMTNVSADDLLRVINDGIKLGEAERKRIKPTLASEGRLLLPYLEQALLVHHYAADETLPDFFRSRCRLVAYPVFWPRGKCYLALIDQHTQPIEQWDLTGDELFLMLAPTATAKAPVSLLLAWCGAGPLSDAGREQAQKLGVAPGVAHVSIDVAWIDSTSEKLECPTTWHARYAGADTLQRILDQPKLTPEQLLAATATSPADATSERCVAGWSIGVLLVGVYAWQTYAAHAAGHGWIPTAADLVATGGDIYSRTFEHGEYYRLLTSNLLHLNPLHLFMNLVALALASAALEGALGSGLFLAALCVGGLVGSLGSCLFIPATTVSAGASGALMGVLATGLVVSSLEKNLTVRETNQSLVLSILIPSLLPSRHSTSGFLTNYAAHFGGAIAGLVLGYLLLRYCKKRGTSPSASAIGRPLGLVSALCYAGAWAAFVLR